MQLIVDGLHITGSDSGEGKTALLLHGWGNDHTSLAPLLPALEQCRVIVPDLPGFGGSQVPPEAWSVSDYADFIQRLLNKLELEKVDVIIGHSFGGRIAIDLLSREKNLADRLVLLASHGLPEPQSMKRTLARLAAKVGKTFTWILPEGTRENLRRRLYRWSGSSDYVESGVMRDTFLRVIKQDVSAYAGDIAVPTLLLYGADDTTTPPELGQRLSALVPGSEFKVIPDAGHYLHMDRPEVVVERLQEWL